VVGLTPIARGAYLSETEGSACYAEISGSLVTPSCPECGAAGKFLPGPYYAEEFLPTLERVLDVVYAAELTEFAADDLIRGLDWVLGVPSSERTRGLLAQHESLEPLIALIPGAAHETPVRALCTFVGLVRSLLQAGAYSPQTSTPKE
jgi:hypothetical protein